MTTTDLSPRFTPPAPCSTCGHQYPIVTLEDAAAGHVVLDPTPTHRCRPTMQLDARHLRVGQLVFIPHFVGHEINGHTRGDWCTVEALPDEGRCHKSELLMRPHHILGGTRFFVFLTGPQVVYTDTVVW